jgi:hypothetical protein
MSRARGPGGGVSPAKLDAAENAKVRDDAFQVRPRRYSRSGVLSSAAAGYVSSTVATILYAATTLGDRSTFASAWCGRKDSI